MLIHQNLLDRSQEPFSWDRFRIKSLVSATIAFEMAILVGGLIWQFPSQSQELAQHSLLLGGYLMQKMMGTRQPTINIDLRYEDYFAIQNQRQLSLKHGAVPKGKTVPATLQFNQTVIPIEVSLKTDETDALKTSPWAYQVDVKNSDRPLGLKTFSLYHPESQSFMREYVWLKQLQREGGLAREASIAQFQLNGSFQGLVVAEDTFSREWIQSQNRPEGLFVQLEETADQGQVSAAPAQEIDKYLGLQRQRESAIALLEGFSTGTLAPDQVFDLKATAKFLAIASFWPDLAILSEPTAHFYYNPLTAKLEPVGYHLQRSASREKTAIRRWVAQVLKDTEFLKVYQKERQRLMHSSYWTELKSDLYPELKQLSQDLYHPLKATSTKQLWQAVASKASQDDPLLVQIGTGQKPLSLAAPQGRTLGDPPIPSLLAQHPFLRWDSQTNTLSIKPGTWAVSGDLIIPADTRLVGQPGTELKFEPDAILLARSPLQLIGTLSAPFILSPQRQHWGGIEVWQTGEESTFKHVKVVQPLGDVFFYQSPIKVVHSVFTGGQSRDGVRIVQSPFSIAQSQFSHFQDDAIDTDQANGVIKQSSFQDIGGDGIDLSQSQVTIRDITVRQVKDRGISVGQNSQLTAHQLKMQQVGFGVSSLDGSTARLDNVTIQESDAALTAYQDRLGFEPSQIQATRTKISQTSHEAVAQQKSSILLNQKKNRGTIQSTQLLYNLGILQP